MRSTGFTCMGMFVVAVTTLLHHETRATPRVAAITQEAAAPPPRTEPASTRVLEQLAVRIEAAPAPEPSAAPAPEPRAAAAPEPSAARAPEPREDRVTSRSRDSRFGRRRRRSRYPGPIPTPADWAPPEGPVRIGLQAGHWRAHEAPRELSGLKDNGTSWRGTAEWEANLAIARRAGAMLEEQGYEVDLLPAVVPPGYRAHLFISIHADGSNDPRASGYRVAAPRRDATGRAARMARLLERSYGEATGLSRINSVTRRMRNYYAFNFRRYEHALHPMTIGVIIETGFLTSAGDRRVIMNDPDRAARGIVDAVLAFPETAPPTALGG